MVGVTVCFVSLVPPLLGDSLTIADVTCPSGLTSQPSPSFWDDSKDSQALLKQLQHSGWEAYSSLVSIL